MKKLAAILLVTLLMVGGMSVFAFADTPDEDKSVNVTLTFTGVEGVTAQYYTSTKNWVSVGVYDNEAEFVIPEADFGANGYYAIRAIKGGMSYAVSNITLTDGGSIEIDVPIVTITVRGVSSACTLAIVQSNWVYNHADAIHGTPNTFNVFDNGGTYELRVGRTGYSEIKIPCIAADADVYLDIFYNIAIPDGVTSIRIANANWVSTTVWHANYMGSDVITLMKNNSNAKLYYLYEGTSYTVDFVLDGSNPFDEIDFAGNDDSDDDNDSDDDFGTMGLLVVGNDEPTNDEPTNDEPANDEPANDEPTIDDPANDEPKTIALFAAVIEFDEELVDIEDALVALGENTQIDALDEELTEIAEISAPLGDVPQTGDYAVTMALYAVLMLAAIAGLILLAKTKKKI